MRRSIVLLEILCFPTVSVQITGVLLKPGRDYLVKQFFFLKENPLFVVVEDQSFKTQYPQIGHICQTFSIFNGDT